MASTSNTSIKFRSKFALMNDTNVRSNSDSNIELSSAGFDNLPITVLLTIFKCFKEEELRRYIMPVCQDWRHAAQNPILWKNLTLRGIHVPLYFICKQIRMFSGLEGVYFDNIAEPATVIRQICRCLPGLKHLAIRYCTPVPETAIRFIISSCPQLESLDLCGTEVRGNFAYKSLSALNCLKKLNLSDNVALSVRSLITAVLNCPNLQDLRVSKFSNRKDNFKDEDVCLILANISDNVHSVSFDCTSLSCMAFQKIFKCHKLERLGLFRATNLTGSQFINIWQNLPNLTELKIRNAHQINDQSVNELFTNGKAVMENLAYLDFGGCFKLTDESVNTIARCCYKLQHLGLKSCKRIVNLRPLFERNTKLNTLNIAFMTNLDTDTLLPLPLNLKRLLVDDSRLFDEWLMIYKKEHKDVKVLIYQSEYNKSLTHINITNSV